MRDVRSVYGNLGVFEWGPEKGEKVVLIHGISTPCIALGAIAHGLVDWGCRVILLDLPGKGYSSTPVPTPHSARLFTAIILLTLTSSPISWTGNDISFSLIGYSLGGGIAVNFTSYFPTLISSLILLALAGLLRESRVTLMNQILYKSGLVSEYAVERLIKKGLLRGDMFPKTKETSKLAPVTEELPNDRPEVEPQTPVLSRARSGITATNIVVSSALVCDRKPH